MIYNKKELEVIYLKYYKFFNHLINRYFFEWYNYKNDLLQECYFLLLNALRKYDATKNKKFMSYLGDWIVRGLRRHIRQNCYNARLPDKESVSRSLKTFLKNTNHINQIEKTSELKDYEEYSEVNYIEDIDLKIKIDKIIEYLVKNFDEDEVECFLDYYYEGKSYKNIASKNNRSTHYIIGKIKNVKKSLIRNFLNMEKF